MVFSKRVSSFSTIFWVMIMAALHCMAAAQTPVQENELQEMVGKKFILRSMDKSIQKYGYQSIHGAINSFAPLHYRQFAGKKGVIIGFARAEAFESLVWILELESKKKLYVKIQQTRPEYIHGIYLVDDYVKANEMVGHYIWINQNEWRVVPQALITPDPDTFYPVRHLEKVKVTGVDTTLYGHSMGRAPLNLIVETEKGQKGQIGYRKINFFAKDPIDPAWDPKVVELIRSRKVQNGMTSDQVYLAKGRPVKLKQAEKNKSAKWEYDDMKVWFKNGKVVKYEVWIPEHTDILR